MLDLIGFVRGPEPMREWMNHRRKLRGCPHFPVQSALCPLDSHRPAWTRRQGSEVSRKRRNAEGPRLSNPERGLRVDPPGPDPHLATCREQPSPRRAPIEPTRRFPPNRTPSGARTQDFSPISHHLPEMSWDSNLHSASWTMLGPWVGVVTAVSNLHCAGWTVRAAIRSTSFPIRAAGWLLQGGIDRRAGGCILPEVQRWSHQRGYHRLQAMGFLGLVCASNDLTESSG